MAGMAKKISFLLGSGVSSAEDLPMSRELDSTIKEGFFDHSIHDREVFYRKSSCCRSRHVRRIQRFICELWKITADLIEETDKRRPSRPDERASFPVGGPRETNYEDVSLALNQLVAFAEGSGGAAETALFRSVEKSTQLVASAGSVFDNLDSAVLGKYINNGTTRLSCHKDDVPAKVLVASNEALKLSRYAVASSLVHEHSPSVENYVPLIEALYKPGVEVPGVITLNHDLILEDLLSGYPPYLHQKGFVDGFEVADKDGIREYNPDLLLQDYEVPLLIKPHGSISWWRDNVPPTQSAPVYSFTLQKAKKWAYGAPTDRIGPIFLKDAGKQKFYPESIWQQMHQAFRRVLRETCLLVISGYGFGDPGINEVIRSWGRNKDNKKVIILHEKGRKMADNPFTFKIGDWSPTFVETWFCNADLDAVLKKVQKS